MNGDNPRNSTKGWFMMVRPRMPLSSSSDHAAWYQAFRTKGAFVVSVMGRLLPQDCSVSTARYLRADSGAQPRPADGEPVCLARFYTRADGSQRAAAQSAPEKGPKG